MADAAFTDEGLIAEAMHRAGGEGGRGWPGAHKLGDAELFVLLAARLAHFAFNPYAVVAQREKLQARVDGIAKWLDDDGAEVFTEQRHVEEGTEERAYWHYGYMVALRDVLALKEPNHDAT